MIDQELEKLKRILFKSKDRQDWTDREAWVRRAIMWKIMAMALMQNNSDENIQKQYQLFMRADQFRSPTEAEMQKVCPGLYQFMQAHQEKSKIVVAKS